MPVIVESDAQRAAVVAALLPADAHVVDALSDLDAWLADHPDEYAIVLGPEVSMAAAGETATRLRQSHPAAGVVLVQRELSTETYGSAMLAGVPTLVAEGDSVTLQIAVDRARQTWEAIHGPAVTGPGGNVITVFSPKGGVGKTTMAVNVALALADDTTRVCLIDLDLAFGDVAITLQLVPEHTIDEAVADEAHLDFALLQRLLTRYGDHLSVLAAPTRPDAKDRIPPSLVRRVLATLRSHFDFLVVDAAAGFDDHTLQAIDETDELILVATLDVPTVKNTKMAVETLDLLSLVKEHRYLVLNRADDGVGLSSRDVESILELPVVCGVPTDTAVASATNHGTPIVMARPDHDVSRTIRNLAGLVSGRPVGAPERSRRGPFGRNRRSER